MRVQKGAIEDLCQECVDLGSWLEEPEGAVVVEDVEDSPREHLLAADDYGTTGAEEASGEPMAVRLAREQPDVPVSHLPVDPTSLLDTAFVGRLVEDDGGRVHVALGDTGGFAAEESAMHLLVVPPDADVLDA